MKMCFPVQKDEGVESKVYNHFGSAPCFIVVDSESNDVLSMDNKDQHHMHGVCNPVKALNGQSVDAIVVAGIGAGALMKLNQSGIKVYQSKALTVKENIEMFKTQALPEFSPQQSCSGHSDGGGCAH